MANNGKSSGPISPQEVAKMADKAGLDAEYKCYLDYDKAAPDWDGDAKADKGGY